MREQKFYSGTRCGNQKLFNFEDILFRINELFCFVSKFQNFSVEDEWKLYS